MNAPLFYWIFLFLCGTFVLWKGGAPERGAMLIAIVASLLSVVSLPANSAIRFQSVETGPFIVDVATLLAFGAVALRADRFWPLWITGIHLVGVATHAAKLVSPDLVPRVYAFVQALWSYPILLLIVIGAVRHQTRLKRFGTDKPWIGSSAFFGRSMPRLGRSV